MQSPFKATSFFVLLFGVSLLISLLRVPSQSVYARQLPNRFTQTMQADVSEWLHNNRDVESLSDEVFGDPMGVTASDGDEYDFFGYAVAIDGDTAIIGATGVETDAGANGAAYIFTRSGMVWSEQQILLPTGGVTDSYFFGGSVAVDGDTIAVGDPGGPYDEHTDVPGTVFVYTRNGTEWNLQQRLMVFDGEDSIDIGSLVAVEGDTLVTIGGGGVYVFTRTGTSWGEQQFLEPVPGGGDFGSSMDMDGNTIVVGAKEATVDDVYHRGAAFVFARDGGVWSQQQRLLADDAEPGDWFGSSVAIDNGTIVVGAQSAVFNSETNQGAVYTFTYDGAVWNQQQRINPDDEIQITGFGQEVAITDDTIVVGVPNAAIGGYYYRGAAYVYTREEMVWGQRQRLIVADGDNLDGFAAAVAIDANAVVFGASTAYVGYSASQGRAFFSDRIKLSQEIEFSVPDDGYVGENVILAATATSGLQVLYESNTPSICTIIDDTATLIAAGECSITASQPGDEDYLPAEDVTVSFAVQKLSQTIEFPALPDDAIGAEVVLMATATSDLQVLYTSNTPETCIVDGDIATLIAVGGCSITALQPGDETYLPAEDVTVSFQVMQAEFFLFLPVVLR